MIVVYFCCGDLRVQVYRIAGNSLRITNKDARENVSRFYFRHKVTMSDHTPYNFPHGNGDLSVYFKACQSLSAKTAMPSGGS